MKKYINPKNELNIALVLCFKCSHFRLAPPSPKANGFFEILSTFGDAGEDDERMNIKMMMQKKIYPW